MTVLNALKPGLDEKLYENALVIELKERGHKVNQQMVFKVEYKGHVIGTLIPDLIVDDMVIADPKVVVSFVDSHVRKHAFKSEPPHALKVSHLQVASDKLPGNQNARGQGGWKDAEGGRRTGYYRLLPHTGP
jgi:GxxExxY protein